MGIGMEDLRMLRVAEGVADEIWNAVVKWQEFSKNTIGNQLVRAADSLGANIAESYGRYNFGEKIQFLYYARGSLYETKYWLNRSMARNLITQAEHEQYAAQLTDAARQINNFINHLKIKRKSGGISEKSIREDTAPYMLNRSPDVVDPIFTDDELDLLQQL